MNSETWFFKAGLFPEIQYDDLLTLLHPRKSSLLVFHAVLPRSSEEKCKSMWKSTLTENRYSVTVGREALFEPNSL